MPWIARCIPDFMETLGESGFGDLTTYELLCGTEITPAGVSPLKYTTLSKKKLGAKGIYFSLKKLFDSEINDNFSTLNPHKWS